ncbi:MAG TPA: hypothetical protein VLV49_16610 [Terriglobales bacterium]|nr:hypothetical protein [Terriglobales bacterium]
MIDLLFTLDYEIYGNGAGRLGELVYEPAEKLKEIFRKWNCRFVAFVEAVEFERIEACQADPAVGLVRRQIRELHEEGFEIGLHLHPQWSRARYQQGRWQLDESEYNLCVLAPERITEIVAGALHYLRAVLGEPSFTPLSFRAGNWLFQPTRAAAAVLAGQGIRIDSSVFKGGLLHTHGLDYRPAMRNGYYWRFEADVNREQPAGPWVEVPIYTEMVPFWKMRTSKRMGLNQGLGLGGQSLRRKFSRALDLMRFHYPLKLDFCRMTLAELIAMTDGILRQDQQNPAQYRPVVAIGHTKDLADYETIDAFLGYLRSKAIAVETFQGIYPKLSAEGELAGARAPASGTAARAC